MTKLKVRAGALFAIIAALVLVSAAFRHSTHGEMLLDGALGVLAGALVMALSFKMGLGPAVQDDNAKAHRTSR